MASINKLQPDQVVYDVVKQKMGNTSTTRNALFNVIIKEIDPEKRWVIASWNGNPPRKFFLGAIAKWRVNKPEPKRTVAGLPSY